MIVSWNIQPRTAPKTETMIDPVEFFSMPKVYMDATKHSPKTESKMIWLTVILVSCRRKLYSLFKLVMIYAVMPKIVKHIAITNTFINTFAGGEKTPSDMRWMILGIKSKKAKFTKEMQAMEECDLSKAPKT